MNNFNTEHKYIATPAAGNEAINGYDSDQLSLLETDMIADNRKHEKQERKQLNTLTKDELEQKLKAEIEQLRESNAIQDKEARQQRARRESLYVDMWGMMTSDTVPLSREIISDIIDECDAANKRVRKDESTRVDHVLNAIRALSMSSSRVNPAAVFLELLAHFGSTLEHGTVFESLEASPTGPNLIVCSLARPGAGKGRTSANVRMILDMILGTFGTDRAREFSPSTGEAITEIIKLATSEPREDDNSEKEQVKKHIKHVLLSTSEAGELVEKAARKGNDTLFQVLKKLFSGEPLLTLSKTDIANGAIFTETVDKYSCSMLMQMQPAVLNKLSKRVDDGLMDRFLFSTPLIPDELKAKFTEHEQQTRGLAEAVSNALVGPAGRLFESQATEHRVNQYKHLQKPITVRYPSSWDRALDRVLALSVFDDSSREIKQHRAHIPTIVAKLAGVIAALDSTTARVEVDKRHIRLAGMLTALSIALADEAHEESLREERQEQRVKYESRYALRELSDDNTIERIRKLLDNTFTGLEPGLYEFRKYVGHNCGKLHNLRSVLVKEYIVQNVDECNDMYTLERKGRKDYIRKLKSDE